MLLRRFEVTGLLALRPQALMMMHPAPELLTAPEEVSRQVAIIAIRGPLVHHRSKEWDSYESIAARVDAACAGSARAIVLKIDSVGGEVYGCFDTARAIRAKCAAAGKALVAYVEGDACSAGYALACAASKIVVADTAFVGSIGIMETRIDTSIATAAQGVRIDIVTSGSRKADRHSDVPVSDEELAATKTRVESLATVFFELVASLRPKLTVSAIRALDAGVFHGDAAVKAGLADRVSSLDALLASASAGDMTMTEAESKDIDTAREALQRAAEGDDEDAEKARKALAALDAAGGDDEEEEPSEASSESTDDEAASEDDDGEKKEAATTSAASASAASVSLAAQVQRMSKRIEQLENSTDAGRKAALFASRPDLSKDLIATLKTTPFALAKKIVAGIPVKASSRPAASASSSPTRGKGQGDPSSATADDDDDERSVDDHRPWRGNEIDKRMGLGAKAEPIKVQGTRKVFGIMTPAEAAERQKKQAAAQSAGKGAQ